ncbi:hypothetical protein ACROYT_G024781 [Oculina patagonica]
MPGIALTITVCPADLPGARAWLTVGHSQLEAGIPCQQLLKVVLETSNVKSYEPCEYEHLHKCDGGFVAGFKAHPNDPDMGIYCNVFQISSDFSAWSLKYRFCVSRRDLHQSYRARGILHCNSN